jgi:hypothetical protein
MPDHAEVKGGLTLEAEALLCPGVVGLVVPGQSSAADRIAFVMASTDILVHELPEAVFVPACMLDAPATTLACDRIPNCPGDESVAPIPFACFAMAGAIWHICAMADIRATRGNAAIWMSIAVS